MRTFIDVLREARSSRAAVLHEFWAQYDPKDRRVRAFVEGHDDVVYYRKFLGDHVPAGRQLLLYRCEGKERVYEAFAAITGRTPNIREVVFFVDKDLDDILGTPWPTDPRIFVTDTYSIENYLVNRTVLESFYLRSVRVSGVTFELEPVLGRFEQELAGFQRRAIPVMAWILAIRRAGQKPNVSNVDPGQLFEVTPDCRIRVRRGRRLDYLVRVAGVAGYGGFRRLFQVSKEMAGIPAKRIVRGKFEAWFLVEFWKRLIDQLRALAKESGGKVVTTMALEKSNCVAALVGHVGMPRSLELFLGQHFPVSGRNEVVEARAGRWRPRVWSRLVSFVAGMSRKRGGGRAQR